MTNVTRDDARFVSQLKNVQTLSFYDTRGAELILEHSRDLPITEMRFEMAGLSKESLRSLSNFHQLTKVRLVRVMHPDEIAIIDAFPQRIAVHIPYPAENEPRFKEGGQPMPQARNEAFGVALADRDAERKHSHTRLRTRHPDNIKALSMIRHYFRLPILFLCVLRTGCWLRQGNDSIIQQRRAVHSAVAGYSISSQSSHHISAR